MSVIPSEKLKQILKKEKYSLNPFEMALQEENVSKELEPLVRSIYGQESTSGTNTKKTLDSDAVGIMQILPNTFRGVAEKNWDIHNPVHNARAGIRYIKEGWEKTKGDAKGTAIYYYSGPTGYKKYLKGIARRDSKNKEAPSSFEYAEEVLDRMPSTKEELPMISSPLKFSPAFLEVMDWQYLVQLRKDNVDDKEKQKELAPYEHRAFARALTESNPLWALPLTIAIPAYQASKKLGVNIKFGEDDPTPPDKKQFDEGFKGVKEGLKKSLKLGGKEMGPGFPMNLLSPNFKELLEKPTD